MLVSGNTAFLESPPLVVGTIRYHEFRLQGDGQRLSVHSIASEINDLTDVAVTIGLAGSPGDGELDAELLLGIAEKRMSAAKMAGGNCVAGSVARTETGSIMTIEEALNFIAAGREVVVKPGARDFAERLLPLLHVIGAELDFQSAVAEIERSIGREETNQSQTT